MLPQHFQYADGFHDWALLSRIRDLDPFAWGVRRLVVDSEALNSGQYITLELEVVFPDGTIFVLPQDEKLVLQLDMKCSGGIIALCLPGTSTLDGEKPEPHSVVCEKRVRDLQLFEDDLDPDTILMSRPNVVLKVFKSQETPREHFVPLARISSAAGGGKLTLDINYAPPVTRLDVCDDYLRFLVGLETMLGAALRRLSKEVKLSSGGRLDDLRQMLLIQTVSRHRAYVVFGLAGGSVSLPNLFLSLIEFRADIQVLASEGVESDVSASDFSNYAYDHLDPLSVLIRLKEEILGYLDSDAINQAVALTLIQESPGFYMASLQDALSEASDIRLIISVSGVSDVETLRDIGNNRLRILPYTQAPVMVRHQLPGFDLNSLSSPPRGVPFDSRAAYFEVDAPSLARESLATGEGLAIQVLARSTEVEIQLWVIESPN